MYFAMIIATAIHRHRGKDPPRIASFDNSSDQLQFEQHRIQRQMSPVEMNLAYAAGNLAKQIMDSVGIELKQSRTTANW